MEIVCECGHDYREHSMYSGPAYGCDKCNCKHASIRILEQYTASLQSLNEQQKAKLERGIALAADLAARALEGVPEDYKKRGMQAKYLKGDNYEAGLDDAADELREALEDKP